MSHTPTKTTHPPQENVTSPIGSSLGHSQPPSLGGPRLNKARNEEMHRRHSSISYRKSPPEEPNPIRFHHARSSLASTWTPPHLAHNRYSLQLATLNLYDHLQNAGQVAESPGQVQSGLPTSKSWASSDGFVVQTNHTDGSRTGSISTTTSNPSYVAPNRGMSLVEQHGDLLTFIAKKERRCLDLREGIQRPPIHSAVLPKSEEELRKLKRKWEIVIGRSLASPTMAAGVSSPVIDSRRQTSTSGSVPERQPGSSPSSNSIPATQQEAARQQQDLTETHEVELRSLRSPHEAGYPDPPRQDLNSWDPFLQHIEPVSSVAKKWVGGIGKGFLDLLQEAHDNPCPSPSLLHSRPARDGIPSANKSTLHDKQKLATLTSPSMPTKLLLEKSIQNRVEAVSNTLQQAPSTASLPSSPVHQLRMRTHAHSSSSNSNSIIDSFDAGSSHRTSMSSIVPTSFPSADRATTTAVHCQPNTTYRTLIQSCSTDSGPLADIASEPGVIESEGKLTSLYNNDDRLPTAQFISRARVTPSGLIEVQGNEPSIITGISADEENLIHQSPNSFHSSKTIGSNLQSSKKHPSRRSTFDFLNSTTGQWTANLTKTLGDITNSET
ncbi:uncharacterized protein MELLADRAFT_92940 [Melampsora larici-populina 98AG31]|uniref:Uncharacterized protein n=1 Tax=Melampsora larici-populina (strain 98AG31 / pathotype 3-4-7) TaxID=747676 RepID=F4S3B5_MELLP|nr:uncharacterized protein MELLADRAFT_92940 [Melampsora larici-populina 98AG31]EGG00788.1 hypothetical protein MELLADRAFT_92940 [Melampsora larici-populina 98AG31]